MPGLAPGSGESGTGCHFPSLSMKYSARLYLAGVERAFDRVGGAKRDFVFAGTSAENKGYTNSS